jgi:alkaline phosphatase D
MEGIYWSHVYGPVGKRIQVILLDARYFRSPLKKGFDLREAGEGYRVRYAPTLMNPPRCSEKAQWKWLEEQLKVPAELRIIGSSYQVLSNQHGWEMWVTFRMSVPDSFEC